MIEVLPQSSKVTRHQQKHQQINWKAGLAFECHGVKIGISVKSKLEVTEPIRAFLPPDSKEIAMNTVDHLFSLVFKGRNWCSLYLAGKLFNSYDDPRKLWAVLAARLRFCVAEFSAERTFIHAGVVAWDNQAILLPGRGFAGKTTLTAELVKAGAVYYSDEFAVLDHDGLVHPYPKPLSLREKNSLSGEQTDYDVSYFNGQQGIKPLPVGLVVITEYARQAGWKPVKLSLGQGILQVFKHSNNALRHPNLTFEVLRRALDSADVIKTMRGEAKKAAHRILRECETCGKRC